MQPMEGYKLRIFIGENDRHEGEQLYEWIVKELEKRGYPVPPYSGVLKDSAHTAGSDFEDSGSIGGLTSRS